MREVVTSVEAIRPRFHPRNSPTWGVTGQHQPDSSADKALVDGTMWPRSDHRRPTHNSSVVGSIPNLPHAR